jgi:hypothetical protein
MLSTEQIREWLDSLHRVDSRRTLATLIHLREEPSEPRTRRESSPAIHANGSVARNRASFGGFCHLRATALESAKLQQLRIYSSVFCKVLKIDACYA